MENKQTAVEWFYQRILAKDIKQVFEQAKAMEKEQLKDAFNQDVNLYEFYGNDFDYYYNKTYNNSKLPPPGEHCKEA